MKYALRIFILTAITATTLLACKSSQTTKAPVESPEPTKENSKPQANAEKQIDSPPPTNLYPTIPFGKLNAEERTAFVKVAKAELCPCEGSTVSLDECLKVKEDACDVAIAAAQVAMQGIHGGRNETDVLDDMSNAVTMLKKVHTFQLDDRPFEGAENAKVKVVEFADFQCPFCKRASSALHNIAKKFEGKSVAFYYKQFPLEAHPYGFKAALASIAAKNQGKFWEMHDLLFDNQSSLNDHSFIDFAKKLGLNIGKFKTDMDSDAVKSFVEADRKDGEDAEIQGTPTVFINGRPFMASPDNEDAYIQKINQLLEK